MKIAFNLKNTNSVVEFSRRYTLNNASYKRIEWALWPCHHQRQKKKQHLLLLCLCVIKAQGLLLNLCDVVVSQLICSYSNWGWSVADFQTTVISKIDDHDFIDSIASCKHCSLKYNMKRLVNRTYCDFMKFWKYCHWFEITRNMEIKCKYIYVYIK